MSRSGYSDDYGSEDPWGLIMYRGAVRSAIRGRRGQAFLREMIAAMDAMPVKELTAHSLIEDGGCVCAIGSVGKARGMDMTPLDPEDPESVAGAFGLATSMVREIVYMNDEATWVRETPSQRWTRMRKWAESQLNSTETRNE